MPMPRRNHSFRRHDFPRHRAVRPGFITLVMMLAYCIMHKKSQDNRDTTPKFSVKLPITNSTKGKATHNGIALSNVDVDISPEWRAPADGYCYQTGNNWSACAGHHMLYYPSDPLTLLGRKHMCLYEPMCWKQLDWRNHDPPELSCNLNSDLRFYDWSYHDGVMASLSSFIENTVSNISSTHQDVFLCNNKRARSAMKNYNRTFQTCSAWKGFEQTWKTPFSTARARGNFEQLQKLPHVRDAHVHIFGFGSAMWEHFMSFNRTMLLNLCHRVDMHRCSNESSSAIFEKIRDLASSGPQGSFSQGPFHIIGPGYIHDIEYIRHYSGVNPVYLPFSLFDLISVSYSGKKSEILINGKMNLPAELKESQFIFVNPSKIGFYNLKDLAEYSAVVVLPYSITNTKSLEQYEMNIPMFAPSPEFAVTLGLFYDRTATYEPYCARNYSDSEHSSPHHLAPFEFSPNARVAYGGENVREAEVFWVGFSEVYLWPCVRYFNSWKDLLQQLNATSSEDFVGSSKCMEQANKWRKFELSSNLCWALEQVDPAHRNNPPDYEKAMQYLYKNHNGAG